MNRTRISRLLAIMAGVAMACAGSMRLRGPLPSAAGADDAPAEGLGEPVGRVAAPAVTESSGLVASRRFPNCYWTHNDSGHPASVFAIEATGKLIREVRITAATSVDWEDIAVDDLGQLCVGDFGNNERRRKDQKIYVIDEPDPRAGDVSKPLTVPVKAVLPFSFPDGAFDCEAMFILRGRVYLLNKVYDGKTGLYVMEDPAPDKPNTLTRVADVDELSITAADADPAGTRIALLSYNHLIVMNVPPPPASPVEGPRWSRPTGWARTGQAEAVCFDAGGIRVTNESPGNIYVLPSEQINKHLPAPASRPAEP